MIFLRPYLPFHVLDNHHYHYYNGKVISQHKFIQNFNIDNHHYHHDHNGKNY